MPCKIVFKEKHNIIIFKKLVFTFTLIFDVVMRAKEITMAPDSNTKIMRESKAMAQEI